ncbi:type II secretion system F family protein [Glycomyces sp. MUSA5-2]|uniref:type II secretion system F family protein n=1 Tax=Glycomyces sp. MUSA5-2 TaxID=2053002 RepID=UPI0030082E9B
MNLLLAAVLGIIFGLGAAGAVLVLRPARPRAAAALASVTDHTPVTGAAGDERVEDHRWPPPRMRTDLAAIGLPPALFRQRLVRTVIAAVAVPLIGAGLLAAVGMGGVLVPAAGLSAFAGLIAYQLTCAHLRAAANDARDEYRRGLATYLGLAAMRLSSGAGIESALRKAAAAGHGPVFAAIRAALDRAAILGQSPWDALADLGERVGVAAFEQLGATAGLAGESGARIGTSLADRARALRLARLAELETKANIATERMSLPVVALATSFLLLIGYPAITSVLTGL